MGAQREKTQIEIDAPPQSCFDALTDYDTFPTWQEAVQTVDVVSRDDQGRGREVHFQLDVKVKKIAYRLEYSYEEPHRITWDYLGGDVKQVDGDYRFEENEGGTLATYHLLLDPGVWVPPPLAKVLREQVMKRSMVELKRRVESL